ncbi:hypothetical protein SEA_MISCHIEF19_66 [Streptomyces phage Mischief19]|nr:hypothetical protein SEA_MISCHIEF19_66 [Streptomyces phage Mischief19]
MMTNIDPLDDSGYWAHVAGEELALALTATGIDVVDCYGDEDGVTIAFTGPEGAAELLNRVLDRSELGPGTFYDRATASCVSLSELSRKHGHDAPEELISKAFNEGWVWTVHPHLTLEGELGWHVTAELPAYDANTITAKLNAARMPGGAL